MTLRRSLAGLIALASLSAAGTAPPRAPLTLARMEMLADTPIRLARMGEMEAAARALEAEQATRWRNDLERADAMESFGVLLLIESDDEMRKRIALPYLDRGIDLYRRALGANDPEVATALVSRVDAEIGLSGDPPHELDSMVEEAARIREARLGHDDPVTLSTYVILGRLHGLRSRSGGDPARIRAAMAMLEDVAIRGARTTTKATRDVIITALGERATILAREGNIGEIETDMARFARDLVTERDMRLCLFRVDAARRVIAALRETRRDQDAVRLEAGFPALLSGAPCLDPARIGGG